MLLGHLALKLPLPESWLASPTPAYRVNLMNATFGALTAVLIYYNVVVMSKLVTRGKEEKALPEFLAIAAAIVAAVRWWPSLIKYLISQVFS